MCLHQWTALGVEVFDCTTWFQTLLILASCQIRYLSHLWVQRSAQQLRETRAYPGPCAWVVRRFVCLPCLCGFLVFLVFLWLNLAQMSLMGKMGVTPSAYGAEKALFLCSAAHTDMQPCFSFLNLRPQAQFYAGLILSILLTRCQPNLGLFC